jgi:hypothetical protein
VATGQVELGDSVYVDLDESGNDPVFSKLPGGALIGDPQEAGEDTEEFAVLSGAAARQQEFVIAA